MLSRHATLGLSFLLSLALYGILFAVAPRIAMLKSYADRADVLELFRVKIDTEIPEPIPDNTLDAESELSKADSIDDLLSREPEMLSPTDTVGSAEMPWLADRLGSEFLQRDHDLQQDKQVMQKVDAKIIEIAEVAARNEIDIVRRLVRPSPNRIIGENEYPTLRGALGENEEEVLLIQPGRTGTDTETDTSDTGLNDTDDISPLQDRDTLQENLEDSLPDLDIENIVARAPITEEIKKASDYEFMDEHVDIKIDTYTSTGEDKGFFKLQIIPKVGDGIGILPKDITFIIDASMSIVQHKLDNTTKGVSQAIKLLRTEDYFNVIIFRDSAIKFSEDRVPATPPNKEAAANFLKRIESRGETDVYKAIRPVLQAPSREGVPGIVFVITDGRPTSGVKDGRTIINALTAENELQNSIFAFGGGRTVNRYLLDLLAYRNKGESQVTPTIDEIDVQLPSFFSKLKEPILVDLKADYGRIDEAEVFPKEIPDFYRGRVVTIYGRYDPNDDKEFTVRLTGKAKSTKKELVFRTSVNGAGKGDSTIAQQWAFERTYYLIGEICRVGEKPELIAELRELSAKYGIRTSYNY